MDYREAAALEVSLLRPPVCQARDAGPSGGMEDAVACPRTATWQVRTVCPHAHLNTDLLCTEHKDLCVRKATIFVCNACGTQIWASVPDQVLPL